MGRPPLTITVLAAELVEGDYIADEGEVTLVNSYPRRGQTPYIGVFVGLESKLLLPDERVIVHLEDDGKEES